MKASNIFGHIFLLLSFLPFAFGEVRLIQVFGSNMVQRDVQTNLSVGSMLMKLSRSILAHRLSEML